MKVNTITNFSAKFVEFVKYTEAISSIIKVEFMIMRIYDDLWWRRIFILVKNEMAEKVLGGSYGNWCKAPGPSW